MVFWGILPENIPLLGASQSLEWAGWKRLRKGVEEVEGKEEGGRVRGMGQRGEMCGIRPPFIG